MGKENVKLARVRSLANGLQGDPRSVFYGDVTVQVDPEDVKDAIHHDVPPESVSEAAIVSSEPNEVLAASKVAAFNALSESDRASRTLLPALATWNAMVIINPMLGKVLAKALDYMLLKTLNDYPYEGKTFVGHYDEAKQTTTVTIDSASISGVVGGIANKYVALPFFRFTIAASTLNAAPGSQVSIDLKANNAEGRSVDTATLGYTYSFQRLNNTEAIVGIYIPTVVIATRTLPFLPIAGDKGGDNSSPVQPMTITITFRGVAATDHVTVTVPGYATAELKEIAAMYNLPSGMIR